MRRSFWIAAAAVALVACDVSNPPSPAASATVGSSGEGTSARFAHPPAFEASAAARAGGSGEDVARLEQEMAALRQDVAALRAEVASGGIAPPAAGRREAPMLASAAQLAAAEGAFRGEAVDPDWSPAMADAVRATISQVDRTHQPPRSVECRSQSCRVELAEIDAPASPAELALVLDRFVQTLPRATAGRVDGADGRKVTVVYLSR